jgi:hypothetical protein
MDSTQDPLPSHWLPATERLDRTRWWEWAYRAAVLVFLGTVGLRVAQGRDDWWVFVAAGLGIMLVPTTLHEIARRRKRSRSDQWLRSIGYLACPECLYELRATSSHGRCPECGTPFDAAQLPDIWRRIDEAWQERQRNSSS